LRGITCGSIRRPGRLTGTSTATHDSGIGINKSAKSLIHLIDEHIDEERGKVIDDLWLTGCVASVSYVDRPWVPRDAKNATGDTLITDGRIAVVPMNNCADPHRADVPDPWVANAKQKPPALERFERNTVLYLRDDFFRGNIVYEGYSGVRTVWGITHKKKDATGAPKMLSVGGEIRSRVVPEPVRAERWSQGSGFGAAFVCAAEHAAGLFNAPGIQHQWGLLRLWRDAFRHSTSDLYRGCSGADRLHRSPSGDQPAASRMGNCGESNAQFMQIFFQ
jgi:hypothetical protein